VRIEVLMVANSASVNGSLLDIQGGGWEFCTLPMLPINVAGAVAGIATLEADELGEAPVARISVDDTDGHEPGFSASMVISGIRPTAVPGVPVRIPFALPFRFAALRPTVVKVSVSHEGAELAATTFAIRDPVPDAPPQQ
jgi:hypothetical protein